MKTKKNKPSKPTRGKLVKKLDAIFSKYVRYYNSNNGKTVNCYTCGVELPISKMQNGHFLSRANYKYRRDIDNCNPQCMACNIFKHGNYIQYTLNMIRDYGNEYVETIQSDKQIIKITTPEIIDKIDYYTKEVDGFINSKKKTKEKKIKENKKTKISIEKTK